MCSDDRLEKLLGMLGSDFEGERANAAKMISDMAKAAGKTIPDFVMRGAVRVEQKIVYRDKPQAARTVNTFFDRLDEAVASGKLNDWEEQFAEDMIERYDDESDLTDRQMEVCEKILRKAKV